MIIWITGLPGSGKTSLAIKLKSILESKISNNIVHLDGDFLRSILPIKMSYSNEDRIKLAFYYSELALFIEKNNCVVICSFVALFNKIQDRTRSLANDYFEILLDPSIDELVKINKNGLYTEKSDYMLKQYSKYEFPKKPDFKINSIINGTYQDYSSEILIKLSKKLKIFN